MVVSFAVVCWFEDLSDELHPARTSEPKQRVISNCFMIVLRCFVKFFLWRDSPSRDYNGDSDPLWADCPHIQLFDFNKAWACLSSPAYPSSVFATTTI